MIRALSLWKGPISDRPVKPLHCLPTEMPARVRDIVERVGAEHGVPVADIVGRSLLRRLTHVRFEAMAAVRAEIVIGDGPPSSPQIGGWFGGRDHTSILHAVKSHEARMGALEAA